MLSIATKKTACHQHGLAAKAPRPLMAPSPEIAGKEDDDREQFQSSNDHEQTEVEFQACVEECEVAHRCPVTEGSSGVGEHTEG